jgi:ketosteroid isomerase-like protein
MSQENVELQYRATDAFNRRDLDAFLALCDPDIEFSSRLVEVEGGGPYRGHDGLRSWWEDLLGTAPDFSGEIEEVRDLGDVTVARLRLRGHGRGSDVSMENTSWFVTEWRNSKAIRWSVVRSEAEALEAAGLRE